MRLINVKAFLERENLIRGGMPVDHRTKVLEFGDDEVNQYAILSHRWMAQEVDYDEMVRLTKMDGKERDEIRQRGGYRKILQSCERAQEDRYEWLWVDTCCVDKRSSAELSEAINSMYRLYENAKVCYAYLHDVHDSRFPTESDIEKYPDFRGWPEWFSRGWTLQELIAPSNVQFFNKDWQSISDKRALAPTLRNITGIPEPILIHGLCENRPCVAQIMSWAAHRTTTRVEDRAYSLMGLLDVNMPMLYGEGKKAFHRLQLEIIRASNDQSIFAWLHRIAKEQRTSILADDPSFFHDCGRMELIDHDEFIQFFKEDVSKEELGSIEDRLSTFPVTNRGIHIWVLLRPYRGTDTFQAWLPCRRDRQDQSLVAINLALWKSNYYRCSEPTPDPGELPPRQLRQVYLRYQDPSHCHTTFEIDDHALTENGFTFCDAYPKNTTSGDTFTLTTTNAICVKAYAHSLTNHRFAVGLGRSFGKGWIRVVSDEFNIPREGYARRRAFEMRVKAPEHAQHRNKACSGAERYGQICIMRTRLPQTAKILQTSSVMWKSSKMRGVKLEVFHDSGLSDVLGEWTAFDVDGTDDPSCDWRGLMIPNWPRKSGSYEIVGVPGIFSATPDGIELGDYGHLTDSKELFYREGNLFAGPESPSLMGNITPRQHEIFGDSVRPVKARNRTNERYLNLYAPLMLSLPTNDDFKSLLASLSPQLSNRYLVTRVIQSHPGPFQRGSKTPLYSIAKPFVWHRSEMN